MFGSSFDGVSFGKRGSVIAENQSSYSKTSSGEQCTMKLTDHFVLHRRQ